MKNFSQITPEMQNHMTEMKLKGATFADVAKARGFEYNATRQAIYDKCRQLIEKSGWKVPRKLNDFFLRIHALDLLVMLNGAAAGCTFVTPEPEDELTFWKNSTAAWRQRAEEASAAGERVLIRSENDAIKGKIQQLEEQLKNTIENYEETLNWMRGNLNSSNQEVEALKDKLSNSEKRILTETKYRGYLEKELDMLKSQVRLLLKVREAIANAKLMKLQANILQRLGDMSQ